MLLPILESFFLVGGTAIALHLGHRKSIDLDLFTAASFNNSTLLGKLAGNHEISVELDEPNMLITTIEEIKVDFVKMGYPILFPTLLIEGVRMLDLRDIAAKKLKAIAQRRGKKDFYDIYFLLDQMSLETMISIFRQKFKMHEVFHIIKSLTYFEDAEQSANPVVFDKTVTWQKVKGSIKSAVKNLG